MVVFRSENGHYHIWYIFIYCHYIVIMIAIVIFTHKYRPQLLSFAPSFLTRALISKFFNDVTGAHLYYRVLVTCKSPIRATITSRLLIGFLVGRQFSKPNTMLRCGARRRSVYWRQCVITVMVLVFRWHSFLRLDSLGSKQFLPHLHPPHPFR